MNRLILLFFFSISTLSSIHPFTLSSRPMDTYHLTTAHTDQLSVYDITDCSMQLACGTMPDTTDQHIALCVAAAFTGKCLDTFAHSNILGTHISEGVRYEGYEQTPEHYAFFAAWGTEKAIFASATPDLLKLVQDAGGMGFTQYWVIRDGKAYVPERQKVKQEYYRCVAQKGARTYILESKEVVAYSTFLELLMNFGVENALYLDMGSGWNHSFYRDAEGELHILHPYAHPYCTNWIVVR